MDHPRQETPQEKGGQVIEFTRAYIVNGQAVATLEEAQRIAILALLPTVHNSAWSNEHVAAAIVANKDAILNILTTGTTSRPKARKANGAVRQKKPKLAYTDESVALKNTCAVIAEEAAK